MPKPIYINPPDVHPTLGYAHAWRAGDTVYVAGQVALDVNRNLVGKGDFAAQAEQVFHNLERVLAAAGAKLTDLVKITSFIVDLDNLAVLRQVRDRYIPAPGPAGTLLVVKSLASPDYLLEIEGIAVISNDE